MRSYYQNTRLSSDPEEVASEKMRDKVCEVVVGSFLCESVQKIITWIIQQKDISTEIYSSYFDKGLSL